MAGSKRGAPAPQAPVAAVQGHQEGSRWINLPPSGDEFAKWFSENVKLHDGLEHEDYVQGITLIPQKENIREVRMVGTQPKVLGTKGDLGERAVYVPYAKVETRIAYFWDYVRQLEGAIGVIEPAKVRRGDELLPDGFFPYSVVQADGKQAIFLGCSMQVRIFERDMRSGDRGRTIMEPPPGTKIVPTLGRYGADPNVMMKAETGAVGRALGMAGMLVIPGSGVATAEDMQEALSGDGTGAVAPQADLPGDGSGGAETAAEAPQRSDLAGRAAELLGQLQEFPDQLEEIQEWAKDRKLNLNDVEELQLRGVVRKLERAVSAGKEAAQDTAAETPDEPAEPEEPASDA